MSRPLRAARRRATLRVQGVPGGFRIGGAQACDMESGMGAGALRAWDAGPPAVVRVLKGIGGDIAAADDCASSRLDAAVRTGTAFPAPPAADMRTESLAARWPSMRNGYGTARHVRRKKEDS